MTPSPAHTLSQALLSLPGQLRERLSHLEITTGDTPYLTCHTQDPQPGPAGSLAGDPAVPEQIAALAALGIVGGALDTQEQDGRVRITLWAGPGERQRWEERMSILRSHRHAGADLLGHAARVKAAQAELEEARSAAARRAEQARTSGLSAAVVDQLLQDAPITEPGDLAGEGVRPQPANAQVQEPRLGDLPPLRPGFVRMPTGHSAACVVCGTPATHTRDGVALHQGECARLAVESPDTQDGSSPVEQPRRERQAADPAVAPAHTSGGGPDSSPATATRKRTTKGTGTGPDRSRFAAAVAAWDGHTLYLPGGVTHPLTGVTHLGELARLVATFRLGHGGGAAMPDRGEIFIYPDALQSLGLPLEVAEAGHGTRQARARARDEIFSEFNPLPVVQDALAAGWDLAGERMDVRTRLTHAEELPAGADITALPWTTYAGNALFARDAGDGRDELVDPQTLVDRLQEFADRVGMTWRVSPGQTGIDLVDVLRPPTPASKDPRPGYLTRNQDPVQPDFLRPSVRRSDARFTEGERVFSWYRPWSQLTEAERSTTYVMAFDHGSHFLNPFTSLELGVGEVEHLVGEAARWDGKETPGYWVVDAWQTPVWTMPDPAGAIGMVPAEGLRIVTAHTLKQLQILDEHLPETLTYREAWVWRDTARYLERVGQNLKAARAEASPAVAAAVKQVYATMVQKFASTEYPPTQAHLRQPAWRDHVVGAARTALLRTLVDAQTLSGISPLVVSRDTVLYAVSTDDPQQAWPGKPGKYGTGAGQWKPVGVAPLEQWGPEHLPDHAGGSTRWNYERGMGALTPITIATEAGES